MKIGWLNGADSIIRLNLAHPKNILRTEDIPLVFNMKTDGENETLEHGCALQEEKKMNIHIIRSIASY